MRFFRKLAACVVLSHVNYLYDQKNLLKPAARTKSGARRYTDQDFAKLQQILLLKYLGFSLNEIREMTIGAGDAQFLLGSL